MKSSDIIIVKEYLKLKKKVDKNGQDLRINKISNLLKQKVTITNYSSVVKSIRKILEE